MRKKFCIVSLDNIYILPYARVYIDCFLNNNCQCDLVFWDRNGVDGQNDFYKNCDIRCLSYKVLPSSNIIKKAFGYIKAIRFVRKILNSCNYSGIVFLQTHAAVFCSKVLKRKFFRKYIVDIRDYMLEGNVFFYKKEKNVLSDSFENIISSPAYTSFLPKGNYIVAHNIRYFDKNAVNEIRNRDKNRSVLTISFIGTVRFLEMDKKILSFFANDDRFHLNYCGFGTDEIKKWALANKITNASFQGPFSQEETIKLYRNTDIINNLYGNNSPFLDYALSNKLYHAIMFCMPILVCKDTYMEDISSKYGIGFVFNFEKGDKERLMEWYKSLDFKVLQQKCDSFLTSVQKDNEIWNKRINDFVENVDSKTND